MWIRPFKWPQYGYWAGIAALAGPKAYLWLFEQHMTGAEGQAILGLTVDIWFYLVLAYGLGLLVSDLSNRKSWIHHNWRVFWSTGDFGKPQFGKEYMSFGEDQGGKLAFVRISIPFESRKRQTIDAIRITASSCLTNIPVHERKPTHYVWKSEERKDLLRGDTLDIPIAFIPVDHAHPGRWGDMKTPAIGCYTEHVVSIEVISGHWASNMELYLMVPHQRTDVSIDHDIYNGSRFFLEVKGENVFEQERFSNV